MLTHEQVKGIVDALPGVSPVESLFVRAVAWHETNYGAGWKAGQGEGSWNMGAITTLKPDHLSFEHKDSRFDAKVGRVVQYTTWFAGYPSAHAGLLALANTVLKTNVRGSLEMNDFMGAVSGMYDNHYFLGLHSHESAAGDDLNITDYWKAVTKAVDTIGKATGETIPNVLPPAAARNP